MESRSNSVYGTQKVRGDWAREGRKRFRVFPEIQLLPLPHDRTVLYPRKEKANINILKSINE